VWNLLLAAVLVWLGRRGRVRAPGIFALYVTGYSLGRIGEELLRVDPAHHVLGLRLNFFVATVITIAGAIWFIQTQRPGGGWARRGGALLAAGGLICLTGCGQDDADRPASQPVARVQAHDASTETGGTQRRRPEPSGSQPIRAVTEKATIRTPRPT
jgi:hypothetical protein